MPGSDCPNIENCRLVSQPDLVNDQQQREFYLANYCHAGEQGWGKCCRLRTKTALNYCPDFVLPDSEFDIDEILNKLEE
jgi:hypothetical protein